MKDRLFLVVAALVVCTVGVGSFFLVEMYRVNPAYLICALNAVVLAGVIGGHFRRHFTRPPFVAFFAVWMGLHGLITIALWQWVWVFYWLPIMAVELLSGFAAAYALFGAPTEKEDS